MSKTNLEMERNCWRWLVDQPSREEMFKVLQTLAIDAPEVLSSAIFNHGFTPEIISLIKEGKKVQAIKAYRENPNCPNTDLKFCKEAIEKYAREHNIRRMNED